jgi:nicotinate-nucleotide--dimethylbenzimidazole phosphoribosyltransferase
VGIAVIVGHVLRHVIESITAASQVHRAAATHRLREAGPIFDRLGGLLAGAQHGVPRAARRMLAIAAGDHGAGDPGIVLGDEHPTIMAARAIDHGDAAIRQLAHAAKADLLLLDCGCVESSRMPSAAVAVGRRPSGDAGVGAALTVVEAQLAVEAGIAVTVSLVDVGIEILGLGAIGLGAEVAAASIVGALLGPEHVPGIDRAIAVGAAQIATREHLDPFGVLAAFGGPETATLTGMILAAASMNLPIILDGEATGVAALLAAHLAPAVNGYLIASQRGYGCMPSIMDALRLESIFAGGVGCGEGAGAAMVLAMLDQVLAPWKNSR